MHDLDRTQAEYYGETTFEMEAFGQETGEYTGYEMESVFGEAAELELAAELLEVTNEAELEQFLGKLLQNASRAVGKALSSPIGRQLGGMLKGIAKQALPTLGGLAGNFLLPGVGGAIGGKLGSAAGSLLGLELEGLSNEDREFEVAKQIVKLGGEAVKQATDAPSGAAPQAVAQGAMTRAAQQHAPGLLGTTGTAGQGPGKRRQSGRWVRRGNTIILLGV